MSAIASVFAWATSPLALARLARKAGLVGAPGMPSAVPDTAQHAGVTGESWAGKVVLGPYIVATAADDCTGDWARWLSSCAFPEGQAHEFFVSKMTDDLVTVPDDVLKGITEECVEITPRVPCSSAPPKAVPAMWAWPCMAAMAGR